MESSFWLNKWQRNEIGFHTGDVHPLLTRYWPLLPVPEGSRVLVPLAGKSQDLRWLTDQAYAVTAVELSELAAQAFFAAQQWSPSTDQHGAYTRYRSAGVTLDFLVGDIFDLTGTPTAQFDAVYDRAALIALPASMRDQYIDTLTQVLSASAQYLLISLEFPVARTGGPPFAIPEAAVRALFEPRFTVDVLGRHPADVKGEPCNEVVYQITLTPTAYDHPVD